MNNSFSKIKLDLENLINHGEELISELRRNRKAKLPIEEGQKFFSEYQGWYSEAHKIIRQLLAHRLSEFGKLYEGETRKSLNQMTYTIQDWMLGHRSSIVPGYSNKKHFDDEGIVIMRFQGQLQILKSSTTRLESSLYEIKQILPSDLFDSEIEKAKELIKKGFLRAAGAVCGVILEKHLSEICLNHHLTPTKKNPTINDYNEMLKVSNVIEIPTWRFIQRLADLRNLCDHKKDREPTQEEVNELIQGAERITKTLF